MAEPFSVNRTLGICMAIIGTLGSASIIAGVSAVWSGSSSLTRLEANDANRDRRMDEMAKALDDLRANRYTAADATADRSSIYKLLDTMNNQIINQQQQIAELRVQTARMESRTHP